MTIQENKALAQRLSEEVYVNWNMEVVDELISPTFICHKMPPGTPLGPEGFKQFYAWLRAAFPDIRYSVDDLIAEDDKVVMRWTWNCTHTGDYNGIPPTGKKITVTGVAIYRIAGGQFVERWVELDLLGLMEQLGPPPAPTE